MIHRISTPLINNCWWLRIQQITIIADMASSMWRLNRHRVGRRNYSYSGGRGIYLLLPIIASLTLNHRRTSIYDLPWLLWCNIMSSGVHMTMRFFL